MIVIEVKPFSESKLIMIFILNVFSHIFHYRVVVGVFMFLKLDSSHWLFLENLFMLVLPLLIVKWAYNFSDT
jgi:hypothetical protein